MVELYSTLLPATTTGHARRRRCRHAARVTTNDALPWRDYSIHLGSNAMQVCINVNVTFESLAHFNSAEIRAQFEVEVVKLKRLFEKHATSETMPYPQPNI